MARQMRKAQILITSNHACVALEMYVTSHPHELNVIQKTNGKKT